MKKRLFFSLIALLSVFSARAYDFEVDGIYYDILLGATNEVAVVRDDWGAYSGSVVIPSTVTYEGVTYRVTAIGEKAFYYCTDLTFVAIPDGVTVIKDKAFYHCLGLFSVTIPNSVTAIGTSAFEQCSMLMSVTIPDGVTVIEDRTFFNCIRLSSVTIPNSVTSIGESAFTGCQGLTSVTIPEGVTVIGFGTFGGCSGLTSVVIPEGVTSIGIGAFYNCSGLTSVTIPESVTGIGLGAFAKCNGLESVYYTGNIAQWCGIERDCYGAGGFFEPWISYGWDFYVNNEKVSHLVIPNTTTNINDAAFVGCRSITSVTISESVANIGIAAFGACSGLRSVTIAEGCVSIGDGAFEECKSLTSVNMPESVISVGELAFSGTSISSPLYNNKIFFRLPENYKGEYIVPSGIQLIAHSAFRSDSLLSVTLPESLDTIANFAFECENLRDVYSLAKNPPICAYDAFNVRGKNLYVPRGSKAAYNTHVSGSGWWRFSVYEYGFDGTGLVTLQVNNESMGRVTGGGEYELDEQVKLEASPNAGYHFEKWDDGNTDNPRMLTVTCDMVLTAMFAKDAPTANEAALSAAPIAYVQGRTAYLADGLGEVEAFTLTGQRVYRGTARTITLPRPGIYVLRVVADGRRCKVIVK